MPLRTLAVPVLLACLTAPLGARAEDTVPAEFRHLRKGLWESTFTLAAGSTSPLDAVAHQLESLPPEKRAQVEAMLRQRAEARGGAAAAGGGPRVHRFCLTQEKLDRQEPLVEGHQKPEGECTREVLSRSASAIAFRSTCTKGPTTFTMEMRYALKSREAISGSTTMEGSVKGQPMRSTTEFSARWVAASCGEVK